jgi:hypothetical protein
MAHPLSFQLVDASIEGFSSVTKDSFAGYLISVSSYFLSGLRI